MRAPSPRTVLLVSIALNLFLASALAAFVYRQNNPKPAVAPTMISTVAGMTPQHLSEFYAMLAGESVKLKPIMHDAKLARREAASLFAAPQMDRDKVLAALAQARANEDRARADLENQVVEFSARLSAEERRPLAMAIRRGMKTNRRTLGGAGAPTAVGKRNVDKN